MVTMLTQQALEADGTQVIFAESFDVFRVMYFAFGEIGKSAACVSHRSFIVA